MSKKQQSIVSMGSLRGYPDKASFSFSSKITDLLDQDDLLDLFFKIKTPGESWLEFSKSFDKDFPTFCEYNGD